MSHRALPNALTIILATASLLITSSPAPATSLSGATLFSSDATGAPSLGQVWNTAGGDFIFNLYLSQTSNASSGFLNSGNGASTSINLNLSPGTTTFFIFGEATNDTGVAGLNLLFNGNDLAPRIAAINQTNSSGAAVSAASAVNTFDLSPPNAGIPNVASPQTLTFVDGQTTVTLTSFAWNTNSNALDLVTTFDNVPDGPLFPDFFGSFTLDVSSPELEPVPEPATLLLLGSTFAGVGLARWRKRQLRG